MASPCFANICGQHTCASPQNRICALIGGGWGRGWQYSNVTASYVGVLGGTVHLETVGGVLSEMHSSLKKAQTYFKVCMRVAAPETLKNQEKCFHDMSVLN